MDTKICTKCEKELPATLDYFHKKRSSLNAMCKKCISNKDAIYHKKNREKRNEYSRNWYNENKEKQQMYMREYYNDNKESFSTSAYKWRSKNKDIIKANRDRYYEENKSTILKKNKKWAMENRQKIKSYHKEYSNKITPSYVATCMGLSVKKLSSETIETKRIIIKIRRELKKM